MWTNCKEITCYPRLQSSRGQRGAHLGPVGPKWAPCWHHEPCYQGCAAYNDKLAFENDNSGDISNSTGTTASADPNDAAAVSHEASDITGREVPIIESLTPPCSYDGHLGGFLTLVRCS